MIHSRVVYDKALIYSCIVTAAGHEALVIDTAGCWEIHDLVELRLDRLPLFNCPKQHYARVTTSIIMYLRFNVGPTWS